MDKPKKEKKFLKVPEYPGGKEAMKHFIHENLQYPEDAKQQGIRGLVFLKLEINDFGKVEDVKIEKGLGFGCNEEAIRVAKLLEFEKPNNRGVRVRAMKRMRIAFEPPVSIHQMNLSYTMNQPTAKAVQSNDNKGVKYEYTIKWK